MADKVEDVQYTIVFDLLQLGVDGDECTGPTHASTAVNHHWTMLLAIVKLVDPLLEGKQCCAILRHAMIRPHGEMKLPHFSHIILDVS